MDTVFHPYEYKLYGDIDPEVLDVNTAIFRPLEANIDIKYWPGAAHLTINPDGSWIDLYTYEETVLHKDDFRIIPLGVAMKLPEGYEANIVPRSSTFKRWGVIQTNHFSVIDPTYCGDGDMWGYPVYATRDITIPKDTRLCQFRINRVQPTIYFNPVVSLNNPDRNGFGSSGA